ncbi:hypothetical protein CAPN002_03550 [Capnocytophaga stomatis]|uniref:DUF6268 family outer membrane beta-barrel protein n=1 Tax=Capnocytophaga stomatis TaxID=1848904 RepID=UPI00194FBEA3|nr:DUF6268 family outer membrane beta-barrel protein [Capnocytophaga stomatis]GIJ93137.1 hypothetical protein CAPN002_03550 [Capnocytophaga stomatis]
MKVNYFVNHIFGAGKIILCLFLFSISEAIEAQIQVKSEYIGSSQVKDNQGNTLAGNGDLKVADVIVRVPLAMQKNENDEVVKATFVSLWGTYASLSNKLLSKEHSISDISNVSLTFGQLLPITEKWSLLAMAGGGIFTTNFPKFSGKSAFLQGGAMALRKESTKFDWGIGASINNSYDYAMITPAFLLNWKIDDRHKLSIFYYNYFDFELSRKISEKFKLSLVAEGEVLLGLHNQNDKEASFVTQFGHGGLRSEFKVGKNFYIPITLGVSFSRNTYFDEKTFKFYYNVIGENKLSSYFATGFRYGG